MQDKSKVYTGKSGFTVVKREYFNIRRKIVANMTTEAWMDVPHASCTYEPDVTGLLAELKKYNESGKHPRKITINTLLLKVIVEGIKAEPLVNAHIKFDKKYVTGCIETYEDINISVPWVLDDGSMMTINLHNFESKTLDEMAEYIADVSRRIKNTNMTEAMFEVSLDNTLTALKHGHVLKAIRRLIGAKIGKSKVKLLKGKEKKKYYSIPAEDRLTKADIEQGTITISNLGSLYRSSYIIPTLLDVVPPQVFVVGIASAVKKPFVIQNENGEDETVIRSVIPFNLTFDHRALDFGDFIPFLNRLDDIFANPEQIHEW
ncbi:MAG: 2-oxo acid dehydrogenase subunit E2 [Clostridia bacterium]|nr:2-oxo acid dehydrogenase subunit E2 [Clostridia bacterium]MBQ7046888.1 2-oxo acid dehydrogenase subunit E2 [Oscillospiraceae bacterium]